MTVSQLDCSRYADGELSEAEAEALRAEFDRDATARQRLGEIAAEGRALRAALASAERPDAVPTFTAARSGTLSTAWLGWLLALAAPLNAALLSASAAVRVPGWLSWLVPDAASLGAEVALGAVFETLFPEWSLMTMLQHPLVLTAFSLLLCGGLLFSALRLRPSNSAHLVLLLGTGLLLTTASPNGYAFEFRQDDERVTLAADETIDDTLLIRGETVVIEGTVTGDVLALGKRIVFRGSVQGNMLAFGQDLEIEGKVGGTLVHAGKRSDLTNATIGDNLFGAAETLIVGRDSTIQGNAALAGETLEIDGSIGIDLLAAAEHVWLRGSVAGNLRAAGDRITLADDANIGGNLILRVDADDFERAASVSVAGTENIHTDDDKKEEEDDDHSNGLFFGFIKLLAALLTGWLLFRLLPDLEQRVPGTGTASLLTLGTGLGLLIGTPIAAVIAMLTIIGVPLGVGLILLWVAAVYLAGIITARWIGGLVLKADQHGPLLVLLVGLVIVAVVTALPVLGGPLKFLTIVLGLGLLGRWLFDEARGPA